MTCRHLYDEHGLCFECNKPIPKRELMARLRQERKDAGLVRLELWIKPEHAKPIRQYAKSLASK